MERNIDDLINNINNKKNNLFIVTSDEDMQLSFMSDMFLKMTVNEFDKKSALVFCLNYIGDELKINMFSKNSSILVSKFKNTTMNIDEWKLFTNNSDNLKKYNYFIDDNYKNTLLDIKEKTKILKEKKNVDFILIDSVESITSNLNDENLTSITEILNDLKKLANETNTPIICFTELKPLEYLHFDFDFYDFSSFYGYERND